MDMVKVFSLTSISTLVRMLTGFISVKIVAGIIGPSGVALVGQLNNFVSIVLSLSTGGINSGITKYIAEYRENEEYVKDCLSTSLKIITFCSIFVGVILILFSSYISEYVMLSTEYGYLFIILGLTILFYALNSGISSVINGFKEFKVFVKINIIGSVIGLVFTIILVLTMGLKGALISAVTFQSIMLFVTLWMIRKMTWLRWSNFRNKISKDISKNFLKYSLMAFTVAATVPVSQMLLRGYVISEISIIEAGWWEGMNRISNMYLMVITTSFSIYYLPRLSELTDPVELRAEVFRSYKFIIPCLFLGITLIYLMRFFIIKLLFNSEFLPMESLFFWQLLGDFFKMASWILSYLMLAKTMTKWFITTEIIFNVLFVLLGLLFIQFNGVIGITQAYMVNYILYMLAMVYIFRKLLIYGK